MSTRAFSNHNFTQFLHSASKELKLLNGAVRKVYDITGKPVQSLDDIKDGAAYVATGGEFFKRAPYLEQEKIQSLPPKPRKTYGSPIKPFLLASESGPATNGRKETPIFNSNVRPPQANHPARMQSKAYRVVVYVNGDAGVPGRRLLLNHRTCKSFSQLLRVVSDSVKTQTSIRRLYNIKTGRQITRLSELSDGMSIAAAGGGGFKRVAYKPKTPLDIGQKRVAEEVRPRSMSNTPTRPAASRRLIFPKRRRPARRVHCLPASLPLSKPGAPAHTHQQQIHARKWTVPPHI